MTGQGRRSPSSPTRALRHLARRPPSPLSPPPAPSRGCSEAEGPQGHPEWSQVLGHPLGIMARLSAETGDAPESVIDPDMVALFEEFLGKGSARRARGPCPHLSPVSPCPHVPASVVAPTCPVPVSPCPPSPRPCDTCLPPCPHAPVTPPVPPPCPHVPKSPMSPPSAHHSCVPHVPHSHVPVTPHVPMHP